MVAIASAVELTGYAFGVVGAVLIFLEFFQEPTYVAYDEAVEVYTIDVSPKEASEYTWAGRVGALALALAFALQILAAFL